VSTTNPSSPSQGGGGAKYAIFGLLLLLVGGGAIYMLTRNTGSTQPPPPPPRRAEVDAGETQIHPSVGVEISLPDELPDSGIVEAPYDAGPNTGPRIRYVYRYVNQCPGSVDTNRVRAVIQTNYGGLRECYNRQLRTNPALQGRVTAMITINTNGTVGQISTGGSLTRDRVFKSCFEANISRMRFPVPRGGCADFEQAFNFSPGS